MRPSLIFALYSVLTLISGISWAGSEASDLSRAATRSEKLTPQHPLNSGDSQDKREPEGCAIMDAATDPRLLASAMLAGLNPKSYLSFMQRMSDPQALRNWLATAIPQSTMDKAYSETDPEFQTTLLSRASESKMATDWVRAFLDPTYFQSAVYVSSKPAQWVNVTADRRTGSMINWFDPRTYIGWMRLMSVPRSQGTRPSSTAGATAAMQAPAFTAPPQRY